MLSMGANAATLRVLENLETLLLLELMNASQAIEYRRPLKSSICIEKFICKGKYYIMKTVAFLVVSRIEQDLLTMA
jgi:histidine ammonia-lyase